MNSESITKGNMNDVKQSIKQGHKICVVCAKESSESLRNFVLFPSDEEKELLKLLNERIKYVDFTDDCNTVVRDSLSNDDTARYNFAPFIISTEDNTKPSLSIMSEASLKQPIYNLTTLQSQFDEVYLLTNK